MLSVLSSGSVVELNITHRVWEALHFGISKLRYVAHEMCLSDSIKALTINACSLTRGTMVVGSDLDDLRVYTEAAKDPVFRHIGTSCLIQSLSGLGLSLRGTNDAPDIRLPETFETDFHNERRSGKNVQLLLSEDNWVPQQEFLSRSLYTKGMQLDKQVARLQLLSLSGQIDARRSRYLVDSLIGTTLSSNQRRTLCEIVSNGCVRSLLSSEEELIRNLQRIWQTGIKTISIRNSHLSALATLRERGLIRFYDGKAVLGWLVHGPRWSDAFWRDLVQVRLPNTVRRSALDLSSGAYDTMDTEERRLSSLTKRQVKKTEVTEVMRGLDHPSLYAAAMAIDIMRRNPSLFAKRVRSETSELLSGTLSNLYEARETRATYLVRLLPEFCINLRPTELNRIATEIARAAWREDIPPQLAAMTRQTLRKLRTIGKARGS